MLYGVFIGIALWCLDSSPFLENCEVNLSAATATFAFTVWCELNRRTRHGAIRTIHTAVTRFGFQQGMTLFALVIPLARVGGPGFCFFMTAFGTSQH